MTQPNTGNLAPTHGSGELIFIVDDEPMLLELASAILEDEGYRLRTFRDPELALQAYVAAQPRPGLVITDYAMQPMNGMELLEKFRQLNPSQKVLLISGTVAEDIYQGSPIQPDRFLAKPYQAHQLSQLVRELLKKQ